jgi:hypothetical protein
MAGIAFKIVNSGNLAASVNSDKVDFLNFDGFSVQCVLTGSPVGTLKLQSSNDGATWDDVPDSSFAVTTAVSVMYNCVEQEYTYFRVSYTRSSGTGELNAFATLKD